MTTPQRPDSPAPLEGGLPRQPAPGESVGRISKKKDGQDKPAPSYYDIPMLKPPTWTWEIAWYFFLGGMSGGAFALARMANRFGKGRHKDVTRTGTAISLVALAPCAPLLIADLGDPKRFHYMLRVFKPKSPMNFGAWVLSAFGSVLSLSALNEWRKATRKGEPSRPTKIADETIDAVADVAGVPLALLLAGYTGVLLNTTSTPLWARNNWLGPLFSASALSSGASAITLALDATGGKSEKSPSLEPMRKLSGAAKVAEAVALGGFLAEAGDLAEPITKGKYAPHLWGGAVGAGIALSAVLESLPVKSEKTRRWLRIGGAAAGLAGGFALRWAILYGGHVSGNDPQAARNASRASAQNPPSSSQIKP